MESEPRTKVVQPAGSMRRKAAEWRAEVRQAPTFAVALGRRLRSIREADGRTAEEIAQTAQMLGLSWHRPTVAAIESGRRGVTATELLLLPLVFVRPLRDLLPEETTWLNEHLAATGAITRRMAFDDPKSLPDPSLRPGNIHAPKVELAMVASAARFAKDMQSGLLMREVEGMDSYRITDVERKAARKLGQPAAEVALAALRTFGRSLAQERDARLDQHENAKARQAARGHVTRRLLAELEPALAAIPVKEDTDGAR